MVAEGFRLIPALLVLIQANQVYIAKLQAMSDVALVRFCLILQFGDLRRTSPPVEKCPNSKCLGEGSIRGYTSID